MMSKFNTIPTKKSVLFLCWGTPWPTMSGIQLRSMGLLQEISRYFELHLVILDRRPPTEEQHRYLSQFTSEIIWLPQRDSTVVDRLSIIGGMLRNRLPYHPALLKRSVESEKGFQDKIENFPGIIFSSLGHWGVLASDKKAMSWILNQCDADIEFWKVYSSRAQSKIAATAAKINWFLAARFFPNVYERVGYIISVCAEDKELTLEVTPSANVDVIENGIDCNYYYPNRIPKNSTHRILFTGTSAFRNMVSLRNFVDDVLPLVQNRYKDVELLVAGNFSPSAQAEFVQYPNIKFTGRVDDIRPYFNQSDVYVSYFTETHGSKLKIAEAMAMAIPIVSTSTGCRGFPLVDGKSVLIGNQKEVFADHIVTLLQDKPLGNSLGQEARKIALSHIDWQLLGQRLNTIINSIDCLYTPAMPS